MLVLESYERRKKERLNLLTLEARSTYRNMYWRLLHVNQSQGSSGVLRERNLSFLMTQTMDERGRGSFGAYDVDDSPTLPAI